MPFIGNQPALSYTSFAKQDFTTSATTSYTLDHPVTNENEIALFINFVRQEPTTAYTASGTSLTLTSATSASDDMYCVFLGKAVQTVNPPSGSVGLSQLSATGTKDATTFLRGDNTFASAGGDNTPAFFAFMNANQTLSNNTKTKIQINTEVVDSDGKFDTSNYRFTPTVAGYYIIGGYFRLDSATDDPYATIFIYKNGSEYYKDVEGKFEVLTKHINQVVYLDTDDYVEMYGYQYQGSSITVNGNSTLDTVAATFYGYKLIGV
jgi:hypothetical protein